MRLPDRDLIAVGDKHLKMLTIQFYGIQTDMDQKLGLPVVILGQESKLASYVYHDDYQAAASMTEYVLSKGRHSIGYIGVTQKDRAVGHDRRQGFLDVMKQHILQSKISSKTICNHQLLRKNTGGKNKWND